MIDEESDVVRKAIIQFLKIVKSGLVSKEFISTVEFKETFIKCLEINNNSLCPLHTRNSIIKNISPLLNNLDPIKFGND